LLPLLALHTYACTANGDIYVGQYVQGNRQGRGVLTLASGDRYEGTLLNGVPYGTGTYSYAGGGQYNMTATSHSLIKLYHFETAIYSVLVIVAVHADIVIAYSVSERCVCGSLQE
jgi:MORN repeat